MVSLRILFIFLITTYYSCLINTNQVNKSLSNQYSSIEILFIEKGKQNHPILEEIILALEQQIVFWEIASKEEIADNLNVSLERIESISDEELVEIRLDNMWLYENLVKSLIDGKSEFQILSTEDNSFKISFKEKAEDSMMLIMYFKYENDNLIVDKKN